MSCLLIHLLLLLCPTSTASSRSQCSLPNPPDLNSKRLIAVFPTGHQPRAPDQSVPRRTATTKNSLKIYQIECQKSPERMSKDMPEST